MHGKREGTAAMMGFDVRMSPEAERFLVSMAKESPKEVRRALGLACSIVRSRMRRQMGKRTTLAGWKDITKDIRRIHPMAWSDTFGGKLVWPSAKQIAIVPHGDHCRVGWIGPLEPAAVRFQDGGTVEIPKWMRVELYKTGKYARGTVPQTDSQESRQVVDPIAEEARGHFAEWVAHIFAKVMNNMIKQSERRLANATTTAQRIRYARAAARGYASGAHGDVCELERRALMR